MRWSSGRITVLETTCDEARRDRRDDMDVSRTPQEDVVYC
jgi:hypothetical protein